MTVLAHEPFLKDADCTLYCGDALEVLRSLPDESVHMCCTSPPFYGLRDYGVDGQIGLEETPDLWVARLVEVFREVRRVLRSDGTFWLEIGDSYAGSWGAQGHRETPASISRNQIANHPKRASHTGTIRQAGLKPKDLIGAPWLLAFALRADGWYLRSEVIWAKPNPMPESVPDRPTTAHSRVFLLAKRPTYFYDAEAIREPHSPDGRAITGRTSANGTHENHQLDEGERRERWPGTGRNRRSVWTIPTEPYPEAHFATWPTKLVEPMILAGTSERGVCPNCGAPWERVVEQTPTGRKWTGQRSGADDGYVRGYEPGVELASVTTGWQPTCDHDREPVPAIVLDPFSGAGTTALVARKLGRRSIGIDLNADYLELAARRLAQQSLFAEAAS